jgi:tetratricopeptide (TPR) repeat protein
MPHLKNSAHGNYIYGINLKDRAELPQTDSLKHLQYMQQATQAFKRATEIYPHFARLWYSLSLSYNTIDSSNLGIAAMKKAYSLDTTHRSVNYFMAMFTLNDTKDTLRAIQLLENEMLLRKENINALGLLITLYKQKKLTQKAFVFLSVLVKNNPENYQPYLTLANIYLARNDTFNYKNYYSIAVQKSKNAPPEFFY